jgi:hypothetical protein
MCRCVLRVLRLPLAIGLLIGCSAISTGASQLPPAKHDQRGNLLPLQSYGETIRRGMKFILEDQTTWAKDNRLTDENGATQPPYFFYCIAHNGKLHDVGPIECRNMSYPAFHHALFIETFLAYYVYSGDRKMIKWAEAVAKWNIAHSTPADCKYANLPYSTAANGRGGGGVADGDAVMTDKPAILGLAYLRLYRTTQNPMYLDAARKIAETLAKTQLPAGNWPFRVNPRTGEVKELYTSSVIFAAELFEQVDLLTKVSRFSVPKRKAVAWVLEEPVKTGRWTGFYEDVVAERAERNRTNYDCIETARYLLAHRGEHPDYALICGGLHDWMKKTFVDEDHAYRPAHAVREQLECDYRMAVHTGHWGMLLAEMNDAGLGPEYRAQAMNIASYITYHLRADNCIVVGEKWPPMEIWYSCHFGAIRYLLEILGYVPEAVSDGETHLMRTSAVVRTVRYEASKLAYATDEASADVAKLAFRPARVTLDGKTIPPGDGRTSGWVFDPATKVLHIAHGIGTVAISAD